jgi:tetratricopeptide (TPR) repeat protein
MKTLSLLFMGWMLAAGNVWAMPTADLGQFEKANLAYREGKFDEAAALYEVLAQKHPDQAAFQFNLGNALYRKGERGTAILAYERARREMPREGDVLSNLNYVRGLLDYRIEDKRLWFVRGADIFLGYFTSQEIQLAALAAGFLFLANWAMMLFFKPESGWGPLHKTLFVLALLAGLLVVVKGVQNNFFKEGIVIAKESQVYYGPSVNDQPAFRLGDGLKVYVVDSREGWSRILIASGESGWIQSDQIAEIDYEITKNITG